MRILYYTLGTYPERSGGLVKYSSDLAKGVAEKEDIIYVYPGKLGILDKSLRIVQNGKMGRVELYKIDNALPIPIFSGIRDIDIYTRSVDINIYINFLKELNVDILHIHTLMGLHVEFLKAAKTLNIPIVMSVHDYFGICPITTLYKNGAECTETCISNKCSECCFGAISYFKLAVGQMPIYRMLKKISFVKILRKRVLAEKEELVKHNVIEKKDYSILRNYYLSEFELIDLFLFNSEQTREVFGKRLKTINGEVVPLVHGGINDFRRKKSFMKDGILHIGFLGETTEFKGYNFACEVVNALYENGCNIVLDVYNYTVTETHVIKKKGGYQPQDMEKIFDDMDILIVPSLWRETLSFITIEALSYAVPCIVSDHVGAKMLIKHGITGFILPTQIDAFVGTLFQIYHNPTILEKINKNIISNKFEFSVQKHIGEITDIYKQMKKRMD